MNNSHFWKYFYSIREIFPFSFPDSKSHQQEMEPIMEEEIAFLLLIRQQTGASQVSTEASICWQRTALLAADSCQSCSNFFLKKCLSLHFPKPQKCCSSILKQHTLGLKWSAYSFLYEICKWTVHDDRIKFHC